MTLGDIATKARFLSNTDSSSYTDANLLIDINLWYQKIASAILESNDEANFDDTNATSYPIATRALVAAQRDYAFSTASWTVLNKEGAAGTASQTLLPLKVKRIDVTYDGTNWYQAMPLDDGEILQGTGNDLTLDSNFIRQAPRYDIRFNSVFIYPMATAADVSAGAKFQVEQERNIIPFTSGQLTTGTLIPGFDAPFHPMLSYGPAFEYSNARQLPQLQSLGAALQDWEMRLRTAYGKKNLDRELSLQAGYDNSYGR